MTAYGQGSVQNDLGRFHVEIQSVNRKYLDIKVHLPKLFKQLEIDIQKRIAEEVERGVVNVWIGIEFSETLPYRLEPNLPLAREIFSAGRAIEKELGKEFEDGLLSRLLAGEEEIIKKVEETEDMMGYHSGVLEAVSKALEPFHAMKAFEGEKLFSDFKERLKTIENLLDRIEEESKSTVAKYREKLKKAIDDLLPGNIENEEKLLREVVVYADKVDIAEEVTRLRSHLSHFIAINREERGSIGKKLDFLVQEMAREANTIGSKSQSIEISRLIVDMKAEIDRMKEQIQNIE